MKRRKEPVFWKDAECPHCGNFDYGVEFFYTPDLLTHLVQRKCHQCGKKFDVTADIKTKLRINMCLRLAKENDDLLAKIMVNNKILGVHE